MSEKEWPGSGPIDGISSTLIMGQKIHSPANIFDTDHNHLRHYFCLIVFACRLCCNFIKWVICVKHIRSRITPFAVWIIIFRQMKATTSRFNAKGRRTGLGPNPQIFCAPSELTNRRLQSPSPHRPICWYLRDKAIETCLLLWLIVADIGLLLCVIDRRTFYG